MSQGQDANPALEGVWGGRVAGASIGGIVGDPPALTGKGAAWRAQFRYEDDPTIRCVRDGILRQLIHPYPQQVILGDDTVAIRYEAWEAERTVYLDGREADPNEDIALLGHSTGSWEGDTLVVETTGFTENLNNLPDFFYYGNGGRLIERYSVDENGNLVIEITFTEPEYLDGPWNVVKKQARMEDYELLEYKCVDRGHGDDIR